MQENPWEKQHQEIPGRSPNLTEVEWFAFIAARLALTEVVEAFAREEEDEACSCKN